MQPEFHSGEPSDREAFLVLMGEFQEYFGGTLDLSRARPALEQLLADPCLGLTWLIEVAGQTAGYVVLTLGFSLEFGGRYAFIDELFLRASYRGQGIGAHVLEFLEQECHRLGVHSLLLEVYHHNEAGKHFYLKHNFQERDSYHLLTKKLS